MKENIKSVVVLTALCLIVAVLLAVTNYYTAPIIEENKAAASLGSLAIVMPEASGFEEVTANFTDMPATVKNVYKETSGMGYVMVLATTSQFSSGDMGITVGFSADGKICGVELTSYFESKDFGPDYPGTYVGQDSALGGVTTVAGCTFSSVAFRDAVTDAFNVLIANGLVAEGQKSEEQLIAEVMPLALPGSTNALGECIVDPIDAPDASVAQAYKAKNGTGYIYVVTTDAGTVVVGVNAFGEAQGFDLEGNALTDTAILDAAKAWNPVLATEALEANSASVLGFFEEGAVANVVPMAVTEFNSVTAAFKAELADGTVEYVFFSKPVAYGNEAMKMFYRINEAGQTTFFKVSEMILHGEYYSAYTLDQETYLASFVGLTAETFSEDMTLISGATMTADAVKAATKDCLSAFGAMKEVVTE